ncbi:MAG: MCE family protein [Actinomycetota bacterium]
MRSFRERSPVIVGIVSIVLLAGAVGFAFSLNRFPGLRGVYSVAADLEDAAGLQSGNEVRIAGVRIGRVTGIQLRPQAARVEMEIENDVRVPAETTVEVKLKTILGQKFIDLRFPRAYLSASSGGGDPSQSTSHFLEEGDVIPKSQTSIPYEIYQAANEGTAVLEEIDKESLREMLDVLGRVVGASKEELRAALTSVDRAGKVLGPKSAAISKLLRNARKVSGTLAARDDDIEALLTEGAEVLGVLAERRANTSSLLAAVDDLGRNLGLLIEVARGDIQLGTRDLKGILLIAESELDSIAAALEELGTAQRLFAQPLRFGRFTEGHVCAVTTIDTCVPDGSPTDPGFPVKGRQQ